MRVPTGTTRTRTISRVNQAYLGLAGFLLVEDAEEIAVERALDLELGVTDIPLMIQDKRFADDGSLSYEMRWKNSALLWPGETIRLSMDFRTLTRAIRSTCSSAITSSTSRTA